MRRLVRLACSVVLAALTATAPIFAQQVAGNPRAAVNRFFNHLKAGQYEALYDQLPAAVQKETSRDQIVASLRRLGAFIVVEKLQIGRVQQKGNLAVIDTTLYGRLKRPMKIQGEEIVDGRVSVQQYLVKEGGDWRVITADDRTRAFFLKGNPELTRSFQLTSPQFSYQKNGSWQSLQIPGRAN